MTVLYHIVFTTNIMILKHCFYIVYPWAQQTQKHYMVDTMVLSNTIVICPVHCRYDWSLLRRFSFSGYVNGNPGTEQSITAEAGQGVVTLKTQSWFQSLRLQGS